MKPENKGMPPVNPNLDEWTYVGTFAKGADIYAKGNHRVLIDRDSKKVICQYEVGGNPSAETSVDPEHRPRA